MQVILFFGGFFLIFLNLSCQLGQVMGDNQKMIGTANETIALPLNTGTQKIQIMVKTSLVDDITALLKIQTANVVQLKEELAELRKTFGEQLQQMQNKIAELSKPTDTNVAKIDSCEKLMGNVCDKEGIYLIKSTNTGLQAFNVSCKCINNEIWTIIQRRENGSVDFYRNWLDYRNGFGELSGEFWLGLEKLHQMTKLHEYQLGIWAEARNGTKYFARYRKFFVADESEKYKLSVGNYIGNATDAMSDHDGMKFSTRDNDNDVYNSSCSKRYRGAWWFKICGLIDLNGPFNGLPGEKDDFGIYWDSLDDKMKNSQMAIRRLH